MKLLCTLVLICCFSCEAFSQDTITTRLFSVMLQNVPLEEALSEFSTLSGAGVTYNPRLIKDKNATCILQEAIADDALRCILREANLSFARLASGTYAILPASQISTPKGNVTGIVRDRTTGHPLPEAHIQLASLHQTIGVVTNEQGLFTLPSLLPGSYQIAASYIGYHHQIDSLDVLPSHSSFHQIDLESKPISITPIIIDGLYQRNLSERLGRIGVENSQDSPRGLTNIIHHFTAVPGVRVNDITADAHVQGSSSGEHQFRLDNVPVFLPQANMGVIGPFSPFAIQSLSVHKSGFGVKEGSHLAGVIEARHFLDAPSTFDIQVDPHALNGRISLKPGASVERPLTLMMAGRVSLWSWYQQEPIQQMLNTWSKPDPFLIFAPTNQFASIDPSFFQETLNINAVPNTAIDFSDLHIASKWSTSPLSGLYASFYSGFNKFEGSLLPNSLSIELSSIDRNDTEVEPVPTTTPPLPVELSLVDLYDWNNTKGQVQYHTILGTNALFTLQARGSSYELNQTYLVLDSLEQYTGAFTPDAATNPEDYYFENIDIPTVSVSDFNNVSEVGIESTLEFFTGSHSFLFGLEAVHSKTEFDLLITSLPDAQFIESPETPESPPQDSSAIVPTSDRQRVKSRFSTQRAVVFTQDRFALSRNFELEAGVRLTYLPVRQTVYAEPRIAARIDAPLFQRGAIAFKSAAGLYRQYMLQLDVSTLNAGALFPSKRIWLLIDNNIRPPLAYHFAQSMLVSFNETLSIEVEGYAKFQRRLWFLNYFSDFEPGESFAFVSRRIGDPNEILSEGEGRTTGYSIAATWDGDKAKTQVVYDRVVTRQRSENLFSGIWFSTPWEEPHRLAVSFDWRVHPRVLLTSRFTGIWERPWGFRQAYYDFFGHLPNTTQDLDVDFSSPDNHILPPLYQLDLGIVYTQPVGQGFMQIRFDVLNALDRNNVADWRLIWEDEMLQREERHYYPVVPSLALRASW